MIARTDDPIPVWPYAEGKQRGVSLKPLYKTAPMAALRDESFYELLVLADALREGRARERKIAENELHRRLRAAHARIQILSSLSRLLAYCVRCWETSCLWEEP